MRGMYNIYKYRRISLYPSNWATARMPFYRAQEHTKSTWVWAPKAYLARNAIMDRSGSDPYCTQPQTKYCFASKQILHILGCDPCGLYCKSRAAGLFFTGRGPKTGRKESKRSILQMNIL